jgi:hypothetical protein
MLLLLLLLLLLMPSQVFEVQAWLAVVVGGLLSYNIIFPTDEPSIARLMGMWSIWCVLLLLLTAVGSSCSCGCTPFCCCMCTHAPAPSFVALHCVLAMASRHAARQADAHAGRQQAGCQSCTL